ncbi:hypothetical protein GOODEAATRI_030874 [Goodea atripinnis]|uniref:Uncharacterized protein n=1 Tax=Goodea atripinnis TaxID=208336 RepID=A0ABV0PIH9_9TELE
MGGLRETEKKCPPPPRAGKERRTTCKFFNGWLELNLGGFSNRTMIPDTGIGYTKAPPSTALGNGGLHLNAGFMPENLCVKLRTFIVGDVRASDRLRGPVQLR